MSSVTEGGTIRNYSLPELQSGAKDYNQRLHEKIIKHTLNTPITTETRVASEAAENPAV
jgi:hypothetical protein